MKKIILIILTCLVCTTGYYCVLTLFPLSKSIFYTNAERTEEYVYSKKEFPIVIVGSSLSGAFEGHSLFTRPYFNLFLPFTGSCTGLEIVRRSHKIPEVLFIEINHVDRGIDSVLIADVFKTPMYSLKKNIPFLLKKNKLFANILDRLKKPVSNKLNSTQPPAVLYTKMLNASVKEWSKLPDTVYMRLLLNRFKDNLAYLSAHGTKIWFYEVPMDPGITNSPLLVYQRTFFQQLALKNGYTFIKVDQSRPYRTGDGVHMLEKDSEIYTKYFINKVNNPGLN